MNIGSIQEVPNVHFSFYMENGYVLFERLAHRWSLRSMCIHILCFQSESQALRQLRTRTMHIQNTFCTLVICSKCIIAYVIDWTLTHVQWPVCPQYTETSGRLSQCDISNIVYCGYSRHDEKVEETKGMHSGTQPPTQTTHCIIDPPNSRRLPSEVLFPIATCCTMWLTYDLNPG